MKVTSECLGRGHSIYWVVAREYCARTVTGELYVFRAVCFLLSLNDQPVCGCRPCLNSSSHVEAPQTRPTCRTGPQDPSPWELSTQGLPHRTKVLNTKMPKPVRQALVSAHDEVAASLRKGFLCHGPHKSFKFLV